MLNGINTLSSTLIVSSTLLLASSTIVSAQDEDTIRSNCIVQAMKSWPDSQELDHQRARTQVYKDCMIRNGLRP